jgi:O-acetyl-ADP-ribose deacetylase (regulator of RNase III)
MKTVKGDLIKLALEGQFDVIVHGCNCFCAMGAGIAKIIKAQFPEAFEADLATQEGDRLKLGSFSHADVVRDGHEITIVNAYTQFHYSGNGVIADYGAIRTVFEKIKLQFPGKRIGYPLIGAGLAGGDWRVISGIIDETLAGEDHTLVKFAPK